MPALDATESGLANLDAVPGPQSSRIVVKIPAVGVSDDPRGLPTYVTHEELAEILRQQMMRDRRKRVGRAFKRIAMPGSGSILLPTKSSTSTTSPPPPDTEIDRCADWKDTSAAFDDPEFPYSASASLSLPVDADALFLATQIHVRRPRHRGGIFSSGSVDFLLSEDAGDEVKVEIDVEYWHPEHLDAAKVCLLSRTERENDHGVGILTKWESDKEWEHEHERHRSAEMHFKVVVTFPASGSDAARVVKAFATHLDIYSQTFAENMRDVHFSALALRSALAGVTAAELNADNATISLALGNVDVQTLTASTATLTTSLGRVMGTYNVSKALAITSSAGSIDVDVNLTTTDEVEEGTLELTTNNAHIDARVALAGPTTFDIVARNSNGHIALPVSALPVDAKLTLLAQTALGAVEVGLPPTYEGTIEGRTSFANAQLIIKDMEGVEDPKDEGRTRHARGTESRRGTMGGAVWWGEEGEGSERGSVEVTSTLASVVVEV
ncbi:DUF4097 domain-containing protein [Mycena kentingensis (nom. inval.)]|nr:DUF4097 domain-containing protein [Mycena kentingensis (nom. inval.)]